MGYCHRGNLIQGIVSRWAWEDGRGHKGPRRHTQSCRKRLPLLGLEAQREEDLGGPGPGGGPLPGWSGYFGAAAGGEEGPGLGGGAEVNLAGPCLVLPGGAV